MILKNCHIYDEISGREKISNIIFSDKIMGIADTYEAESDFRTLKISELTEELIAKINLSDSKYILDSEGMTLIPGGIDSHVHFDTPGYTDREDFYHGSMSAAAGGITTVIDMPCTSIPPVTNGENFEIKAEAVKGTSVVDYAFYGGIYTRKFDTYKESMNELADKGVKGFKVYFTSGMDTYPRATFHQFFQIMRHAKELKIPVLLHAEDHDLILELRAKYQKDPDDYIRYYKTRPQAAEVISVKKAIETAKRSAAACISFMWLLILQQDC
jgi:allantoinase